MEHHPEHFCSIVCPLLHEKPWACQEHCDYEPERQVWLPAVPRSAYRRRISQFVKRDPREFYHAHPVASWMLSGRYTGDPEVDEVFPAQ